MSKILFFDIDGTLADKGEIVPNVKEALNKVRSNGNLVFICSGRTPSYQKLLFSDCADGYICNNGRYAMYQDHDLFDYAIDNKVLKEYVEFFNDNNIPFLLNDLACVYVGGIDSKYSKAIQEYHGSDEEVLFDYDLDTIKVYNFDIFFKDNLLVPKMIQDKFNGELIVNNHGDGNADLSTLSFTKGDAIKEVLTLLNIKVEDSYAFGDGHNDLAMIENVGHGVAMGNAKEEVKKASEFISDNFDNDGVINALKHYNLI